MAEIQDYDRFDAMGLADLLRRREVSAEELLETALTKADAIDSRINAVVQRFDDAGRQAIAAGLPDGPLSGVPFLVKDLFAFCAGQPCGNGSRLYDGFRPGHDHELVARYRRAGLVIFGRTATSEFGLSVSTETRACGATRNPWNLQHSTGGSSGGAAAAVAAGILPAAHASDGGGSIRIPAAACGLFGLKPTRARTPAGPDVGEGWAGLSVGHVVTRTVRDSAAFLDATHGPAPGDPYAAPPPARPFLEAVSRRPEALRIAYSFDSGSGVEVHPDCRAAVEKTVRLLDSLGHRVVEAAPPIDFEELEGHMTAIVAAQTRQALDLGHPLTGAPVAEESVEPLTWAIAELGREVTAGRYIGAVNGVHRFGRRMAAFLSDHDLYLCPTLAKPPVPLGYLDTETTDARGFIDKLRAYMPFTQIANMTGQPAASLPLHWNDAGLPIGVQLLAPYGDEAGLLGLAAQLEEAAPWAGKRPPL